MEKKEKRTGIKRLLAIGKLLIHRLVEQPLSHWKYKKAKEASRKPLDPDYMKEVFGQPTGERN